MRVQFSQAAHRLMPFPRELLRVNDAFLFLGRSDPTLTMANAALHHSRAVTVLALNGRGSHPAFAQSSFTIALRATHRSLARARSAFWHRKPLSLSRLQDDPAFGSNTYEPVSDFKPNVATAIRSVVYGSIDSRRHISCAARHRWLRYMPERSL